jgi:hypothetical protein
VGFGLAHHPGDCAIGIPWADCLPGTAGYNNGGGAETRQQHDAPIIEANHATSQALDRDCQAQLAAHDLDPIRGKVELVRSENTGPPPFAILSNESIPTPDEKVAIAKWATIRDGCFERRNQWSSSASLPSNENPLVRDKYLSFDRQLAQQISVLIVALYEGKMTYSEFARERADIGIKVVTERQEWMQAVAIAEQQRHSQQQQLAIQQEQLAEQQYQTWLQASMQQTQLMQSQLQSLRPTMTNCSWIGNVWHCRTQ